MIIKTASPDHADPLTENLRSVAATVSVRSRRKSIRKLTVRFHIRGYFFVREAGKDLCLGTNFHEAQARAIALLGNERINVRSRPDAKAYQHFGAYRRKVQWDMNHWRSEQAVTASRSQTFRDAAVEMLNAIEAEKGRDGTLHYRKTLATFVMVFGDRPVGDIPPAELLRYRTELIRKYAPKSVNHHLASTRRLLGFCYDMDLVKQPLRTRLLKSVPLPPTPDKSMSPERVREIISAVAAVNSNLAKMMLLQYWTCMRPSEVSKVLFRQGDFDSRLPWVFRLSRGKTDLQTGEWTRIIFTDEALQLLKTIEPAYAEHRYYCRAVQRVAERIGDEFSPGPLRHSAATTLIHLGVGGETVEACLHHLLRRVQRTYRPQPFHSGREALTKLAREVPLTSVWQGAGNTLGALASNRRPV